MVLQPLKQNFFNGRVAEKKTSERQIHNLSLGRETPVLHMCVKSCSVNMMNCTVILMSYKRSTGGIL